MQISSESRVQILTVLTGLVVTYVRHGLQYGWGRWESTWDFFASWLIHYIALYVLVFLAGYSITRWSKFFLDEERDFGQNMLERQYSIIMTALIAALAILFLSKYAPLSDD